MGSASALLLTVRTMAEGMEKAAAAAAKITSDEMDSTAQVRKSGEKTVKKP